MNSLIELSPMNLLPPFHQLCNAGELVQIAHVLLQQQHLLLITYGMRSHQSRQPILQYDRRGSLLAVGICGSGIESGIQLA